MGNLPTVCAASVTPVDIVGAADTQKLSAHCHWLLNNGCDGVVLFGTTGEAASFGIEERRSVLEEIIASGIDSARLIVGTGCCSVEDTMLLSRHALATGCAGILIHPPFFFRPATDEGSLAFFTELVESLGADARDIVLYHFPDATGAPINSAVIEQLMDRYPSVFVGIKDSTGNLDNMIELSRQFPDLKVYTGDDHLLWPLLEAGGYGAITATANLMPNLLAQVRVDWHEKRSNVHSAHATLSQLWEEVLLKFPISEAVKEVVASVSGDNGWRDLRPPLSPLPVPLRVQLAQMVAPFADRFPLGLGERDAK
ncbi:4-hydroxy-tetrahydrodipicolinate synthase [Ruegeria halocynthiae]|uniref:4-hydroxy-tetrahydrodipicolinate synthase n=1 Tax=Ruegeria halocynthiae TaxID=985054 RepID=A0A1H3EHZ8_9RHOB|nr:dihydrodipicolinate synthase family protein [Ruegeria halocynthiae]SDX78393.1 4-hydroxy-tetrahydrodipicolinate synthase [Ruegeria halocynthiae]